MRLCFMPVNYLLVFLSKQATTILYLSPHCFYYTRYTSFAVSYDSFILQFIGGVSRNSCSSLLGLDLRSG